MDCFTNSGIIIYDDKQCAVSCCCCYPYCSNIFTNSSMSRVPSPSCRYFIAVKIEQFNHPSVLPCRLLSWTRPLHPWWGLFPGSPSLSSVPSARLARPCFGQKSEKPVKVGIKISDCKSGNDNSQELFFSTLKSCLESLPEIQIDVIIFN